MTNLHLGRGECESAVQTFNIALYGALGMGVLVMTLGNLFIHPLAAALGSTPEIHQEAIEYMRYIVTFSPFLILSFLLSGLARNDGRPRLAMAALAVGSISNIVLDYVFMYPLNMGIGGAALATAIGPVFSVLILLPHFLRRRGALTFARTRPQARLLGRVYLLGFPSFIMEFTISIITFIYNSAIVRHGYGELGLAAYLVIGYLMLIILTVFLGMAEGLQPVFRHRRRSALPRPAPLFHRRVPRHRRGLLSADCILLPLLLCHLQPGGRGTDRLHAKAQPAVLLRFLPGRLQYPDDLLLAVHARHQQSACSLPRPQHRLAAHSDGGASGAVWPRGDLVLPLGGGGTDGGLCFRAALQACEKYRTS